MSAWIVSAHHIDALAGAATRPNAFGHLRYRYNGHARECRDPDAIGRILLAECVKSVQHRYPDDSDVELPGSAARPDTYWYRTPDSHAPVVLLKAIDCYEYQSCEHPDWEKSEAHAICDALRDRLIGQLPGYDEAPWGIEEREPAPIPFSA